MANTPEAQWVKARLDAVAPAWTPDPQFARHRLSASRASRAPWRRYATAMTTMALLAAVCVLPPVRSFAQSLWYRLTISRIDVVRLDVSKIPVDTHVRTDGTQVAVDTLEEAASRAGFRPVLPSGDLVPGVPALSVTGQIDVTQRLRAAELQKALAAVGADDLEVPASWDGAELRVSVGPLVIAEYEGVSIVQSAPIRLQVPSFVDLAALAEVMFRAAGSSWWEARILAEAYAASPAWLLDIPEDEQATVEAVSLENGTLALVIDESNDDGTTQATVLVSTPERLAAVTRGSREMSLRVAQAIAH